MEKRPLVPGNDVHGGDIVAKEIAKGDQQSLGSNQKVPIE